MEASQFLADSYHSAVKTHSLVMADHAASITYQSAQAAPDTDLLHELADLYNKEKAKLQNIINEIKALEVALWDYIWGLIKNFFEQLAADVETFFKQHGINL